MSIAAERMYREYPARFSRVRQTIGRVIARQSKMIDTIEVVCGPSKLKIGMVIANSWIAIRYRKKSGIA